MLNKMTNLNKLLLLKKTNLTNCKYMEIKTEEVLRLFSLSQVAKFR
jgi:hypothetical protein